MRSSRPGSSTRTGEGEFTLWHPETHPRPEKTTLTVDSGPSLKVEFAGEHQPHILRIHSEREPVRVVLDGREWPKGEAWQFDAAQQRLVIRTRDYAQGRYEICYP